MADFPAVILASSLDGASGFKASGQYGGTAGFSVSSAGDLNGDGFEDLVIGVRLADVNESDSGSVFVLFGRSTGFPANFDIASLPPSEGFRINGEAYGLAGTSVASLGDINGDGIDDLIIGAYRMAANGISSGASYVVFGSKAGFPPVLELSSLDGDNGFQINGEAAYDQSGWRVASAGDVNNDGTADFMITSVTTAKGAVNTGSVYIVFGSHAGFPANLNLSDLDGGNGFRFDGVNLNAGVGRAITSAGDINGDGIDDLAFSSIFQNNFAGATYVLFGRSTGFDAVITQAQIDGLNGFAIRGAEQYDYSGGALASGDINGDGLADLIIGADGSDPNGSASGAVHVVFGSRSGFGTTLALSALDGSNGFTINGMAENDHAGQAVAIGDVNGDGLADIIIGATYGANRYGAAYVVLGKQGGYAASLELSDLSGPDGFRIEGEAEADWFGWSVSAADIDGDQLDDIIVGAPLADPNYDRSGATYVIFGRLGPMRFNGTAIDDHVSGRDTHDILRGNAGNDVLYGMAGDDLIDGGDLSDLLYGGDGADDLVGGAGGDILYGDAGDDDLSGGDGNDKLFGGTGADNLNGGTGNDRMDGEANVDTLRGGAGNDTLDGGLGADFMYGGADNDIYIVDDANDQTIELPGEGYDIVRTTLSWTLADNVEALELQGLTNANGMGNSAANRLDGNGGDNILNGMAGVDTINGADGDDTIIGGQGNDLLRGGIGADTFKVSHALGTVLETDQIYDFSAAEGDRMDFSDLFAGTIQKVTAFNHNAGQMTLTFAAGITTVRLDIDGNGSAEYQVKINGDVTADWGGWLL